MGHVAQKSKLYIGTGTGSAKSITAITQAFRAQVTSSAHGLAPGDRVTFASVGGMTGINTLVGTVLAADTNTFVVNIDTRAFSAYTSGGTATPVEWTQVKGLENFEVTPGEREEVDVTDLDDDERIMELSLKQQGAFSASMNAIPTDAGQTACFLAYESSEQKQWKLEYPGALGGRTFDGQVRSMPESGAVGAKLQSSFSTTMKNLARY